MVAAEAGTGQRYATQVGRLWSGLAGTLTRLEALAAEPGRLDDEDALTALRSLQYRLHTACERAYGLAPPHGTEEMHAELAAALEGARDATGETADVLEEDGPDAAQLLVHEWRGALFRVRLARLRLAGPRPKIAADTPSRAEPDHQRRAALVALLLAIGGAAIFAAGAGLGRWPVWVIGIGVVCASFVAYRP